MNVYRRLSSLAKRLMGSPVFRILSGASSGQLLLLLGMPVVLLQYDPGEFGEYTLVLAFAIPLACVLSLRLELAVPLPASHGEAVTLARAGLISATVLGLFGTAAAALVGNTLLRGVTDDVWAWTWAIPITGWCIAVFQLANAVAIRHKRYAALARRGVVLAATTISLQGVLGFAGMGAGGLIFGYAAAQLVVALTLIRWQAGGPRERIAVMVASVRVYSRVPLHLMPAGLLNALALQAPALVIGYWYGVHAAGQYGLAQRLVAAPASLVVQSIASVFLAEFSSHLREGRASRAIAYFRHMSVRLLALGTFLGVVLAVCGPHLVAMFFGEEWVEAGQMTQAMSLALVAQVLASPVSQTLIVMGRTITQLTFDAVRLICLVSSISVVASAGAGAVAGTWALSIVSAVSYLVVWWLSQRAVMTLEGELPDE